MPAQLPPPPLQLLQAVVCVCVSPSFCTQSLINQRHQLMCAPCSLKPSCVKLTTNVVPPLHAQLLINQRHALPESQQQQVNQLIFQIVQQQVSRVCVCVCVCACVPTS